MLGQRLQLGPLGFLISFDSIWAGRELPPSLLRKVCFGWRSDPATGPEHPTSPFSLSKGSLAWTPAFFFLLLSSLTRLPLVDPGYYSVSLSFGVPDAQLGQNALQTLGHRAIALLPHNQLSLGLQRAQSPLCLSSLQVWNPFTLVLLSGCSQHCLLEM